MWCVELLFSIYKVGISISGLHSPVRALTAVLVYGLASVGTGGATPIRLALAGACLDSITVAENTVSLPNTQVMDQFRFWQVGSISGASWEDIKLMSPYLAVGFVLAFFLVPSLNTLALGDDVATGLGVNVTVVRGLAALSGVLLCAAVTALAGPISFIGLMVPHPDTRTLLIPDLKKIMPLSAVCGACVFTDFRCPWKNMGEAPGELESGIVTALIGGPVFIFIIRKVRVRSL